MSTLLFQNINAFEKNYCSCIMVNGAFIMDELTNAFGKRLKDLRIDLRLTQDELAFECDMQSSHIGQLERGVKSPTLDTLNKISFGLNIPLSKLLDFDNPLSPLPIDRKDKIFTYLHKLKAKDREKAFEIIKILAK